MLRRALVLAAALGVAACGGDSTGASAITGTDFVGTWEVQIPAKAGCWSAFALRFPVTTADATAIPNVHFINIVSSDWYEASDPSVTDHFSGNFNWGENTFGFVFLIGGSTSLRMEGTGVTASHVTGTFRDRDGVAFPAACSVEATATHLST